MGEGKYAGRRPVRSLKPGIRAMQGAFQLFMPILRKKG
jgi:hypothetical protein